MRYKGKWYGAVLFTVMLALVVTAVAVAAESRNGAWVDEVVVSEEPSAAAAVTRLGVDEIDLYAFATSDAEAFERVQNDPSLAYERSFGSYSELTFNPAGPVFEKTGKLNPFAVPAVREAMNWLIDRDYIAEEIYSGLAVPKYMPITSSFPDYARLADVARSLELKYAHNPDKAEAVISREMQKLGAQKVDGKWQYKGEPVTIIILIRTEDERRDVGDYVASLLEDIGFTVDRQYKTSREASPIWIGGDPNAGQFHIYTGGWVTTAVSRDQAGNLDFFYTPRGLPFPLWQGYHPSTELDDVADRLNRRDFSSMAERKDLFAEGLELALKDSVRIWLVDRLSFIPHRAELNVTADLAGGVSGTFLWPHTIRLGDKVGGKVDIAMPSILPEPWNPIAGSNWVYDMMLIRGTSDVGLMPDPFTGLSWPQRIDRAEVTVKEGLPVAKTHDWVDLKFADQIDVPADAWIDWDAEKQQFITVGEKYPDGLTSLRKSVVYYPEDVYKATWHDGSHFSAADVVMSLILTFDRANEKSAVYDEAEVPNFESFQKTFKGARIVSRHPLVVEFYSDQWALDAEDNVTTLFPDYNYGNGAWHQLAVGLQAEANKELAFSKDKANKLEVEWLNMISGPSLDVLAKYLVKDVQDTYIPYEPTLGKFIDENEAIERWSNLDRWYAEKGHFWIGMGPVYLEKVFPVEGIAHLKRYADYIDPAGKWDRFKEPMIAEVEASGARRVKIGESATFDVSVTFDGNAYPAESIDQVKFLLFDAKGNLSTSGTAAGVKDGEYLVTLTEDQTKKLSPGANRLEVIVVPLAVSIPSTATVQFITTP